MVNSYLIFPRKCFLGIQTLYPNCYKHPGWSKRLKNQIPIPKTLSVQFWKLRETTRIKHAKIATHQTYFSWFLLRENRKMKQREWEKMHGGWRWYSEQWEISYRSHCTWFKMEMRVERILKAGSAWRFGGLEKSWKFESSEDLKA